MKITPLENVTGTLANADVIKCWFKCDETTADTTLIDSVGGITVAASVSAAAGGTVTARVPSDTAVTGTLPAPGAGADFVLLAVIEKTAGVAGTFTYGAGSGHNITVGVGAGGTTVKGATGTSGTLGTVTGTGVRKVLIVADASGNTTLYDAAAGASLAAGAGTPVLYSAHGDLTATGNAMTISTAVPDGPLNVAGAMLLSFAGGALPSNIVNICDWMMEQWIDNNKSFYPPLEFL